MSEPKSGSPAPLSPLAQMTWASVYLGVPALALALGIEERSARAKLSGDRGISPADLRAIIPALEQRAIAIANLLAALQRAQPSPPAIERIEA